MRSKFLEAFLSRNYTDSRFWSAGTHVSKGARFEFDLKFLRRFGVAMGNLECRTLDFAVANEPVPSLLLLTEQIQREEVTKVFPNSEILMLDKIATHLGLHLRDPMGFSKPQLELELYKYAFVACYALNRYHLRNSTVHSEIRSIVPKSQFSFEAVETKILTAIKRDNVLVLHSGIAASRYRDSAVVESHPIPMKELPNFSKYVLANREARVFHFEHEVVNPEITLPSLEWRKNIRQIGLEYGVLLYSSPFFTSRGLIDPLSLFGTLPSLKISML